MRARPKLVWIRAFQDCYNPLLALQVLQRLSPDYPSSELLMAGPDRGGISAEQVSEEARRLGLNDRVRIVGPIIKACVPETIQKGDIFLNTTNVDNAPVIVVEAMACGSCVVSTDAGGVADLVEHESEALLVPRNDPEAMAAAINRILSDSALAERLSTNARRRAEMFSWERVLDCWEDLLTQAAGVR